MTHFFDPVGVCIYCGNPNDLTDEHIVPFGLGGVDILPSASCKACAKITGKIEGVVQRTILGDFRIHFNLPTRRKKERPKTKLIEVDDGRGGTRKIEVPSGEYPPVLWVYTFGRCGLLLGAPATLDVSMYNMVTIHNNQQLVTFTDKYRWDKKVRIQFRPNEFRRMLAKIGYSFLVALAGYGTFTPLIIPAIMNENYNISYLVGQNPEIEPAGTNGEWFDLRIRTMHAGTQSIFIVEIRLFQQNPVPTYHVVVGETNSPEQYERVMARVRNSDRIYKGGKVVDSTLG
jgi:hypothetical protein